MSGPFGAYGKMPGLGDFLRMGVGSGFVAAWDRWLQVTLFEARATLGHAWTDCYMSAPIWRFALAPGLAGRYPVFGVLMPSVDRVGRQFPLTLVARGEGAEEGVYAQLEEIALASLEDDMTRAGLQIALNGVSAAEPETPGALGSTWKALMGQGMLEMTASGLPAGAQALRLFDLSRWDDVTGGVA